MSGGKPSGMSVVRNDNACNAFHMARGGGRAKREGTRGEEVVKGKGKAAPRRLAGERKERQREAGGGSGQVEMQSLV